MQQAVHHGGCLAFVQLGKRVPNSEQVGGEDAREPLSAISRSPRLNARLGGEVLQALPGDRLQVEQWAQAFAPYLEALVGEELTGIKLDGAGGLLVGAGWVHHGVAWQAKATWLMVVALALVAYRQHGDGFGIVYLE
ncbi:hypothetical protein Thiosp_04271 [Thiorhodovibrio litoralis]|nr:hypothetical protein Thiosp_04271 [Thiorhodovibrio litoralis]